VNTVDLRGVLDDNATWETLVSSRRLTVRQFLRWAAACESKSGTSLRLEYRDDVARCRDMLSLFDEPWWAVCVYSCFDSCESTQAVADKFRRPIGPAEATRVLEDIGLKQLVVRHHRAQSTRTGARRSLISACEKATEIEHILGEPSANFEDRFTRLRELHVAWWGRTTCFDVLVRAGVLGVSGNHYRPRYAQLRGSTGPAYGFALLWDLEVTSANSTLCEELLHAWTADWAKVCDLLGVGWVGASYDSADLENALCIFQEATFGRFPDPGRF
jgi:hypothetical protein